VEDEHDLDYFAEIAYLAYCDACGGRSVRGEPLPSWAELAPKIRAHWRASAAAVKTAAVADALLASQRVRL
jgi:hypothetical protein